MIISWWSAGVTSAVATKLAIDKHGKDNVLPVYFHIDTAHPDNERFIRECEEWYGRDIIITKSHKHSNHFEVIEKDKYVNGPGGARHVGSEEAGSGTNRTGDGIRGTGLRV